jgi:SET family sugar efflux transporter-like MFS transporter
MSLFGTREVGMTPLAFGVFMTTTSVSGILLSTHLARWSDTLWSRRSVLMLGGVMSALGYVGYAVTRNVWLLGLFGAVFTGIGSVTFSQLFALSRDVFELGGIEPRRVPLFMNIVRLFYALAWTAGPAVGAALVARSFALAFAAAAALLFAFAALVALLVPATPPSEKTREAARQMPLSVACKNPLLLANFAAFSLYAACGTMGMLNLPLLLLNELRGSEHHVGIAYSIAPVFELPFMVYAGILASRIRLEKLVAASMLLACFYYTGLYLAHTPEHVYALQIASAAIVAVMSGVAISFFQAFLPNQPGSATNLFSSASKLGGMIGYLAFGTIAGQWGHRAVFAFSAVATLIASSIVRAFRQNDLPSTSDVVDAP